jgi:fructose-bisphosphate aldolase class II
LENNTEDAVFFDELSLKATAAMKDNVKAAMEIFMKP